MLNLDQMVGACDHFFMRDIEYWTALGLADTLLAGRAAAKEVAGRCADALHQDANWVGQLARTMLRRFRHAWHDGSREGMALAILKHRGFRAAYDGRHPPRIRHFWLQPPVPAPRAAVLSDVALPELATAGELATWLAVSLDQLNAFTDPKPNKSAEEAYRHYVYRWVDKRTVGQRLLEVPKLRLRAVQRRILHGLLDAVPCHECAHGFRAGRSTLSGAQPHLGHPIVVNFDLKDFFLSVTYKRVTGLFRWLGYPRALACALGALCTNRPPKALLGRQLRWLEASRYLIRHLPQGAPTSPALANLCAFRLDVRLGHLARSLGANYTRYADDLTFSGQRALAGALDWLPSQVDVIAMEEGFQVNHRKTSLMRQSQRQLVTGLVVNAIPNIARPKYDELKAILHNCARLGPASQNRAQVPDFRAHLQGRVAQVVHVNPARGQRLRTLFDNINWSG